MTSSHTRSSIRLRILCFTAVLLLTAAPLFAQKADLTRLVIVGDSLSAGYQNSSLISTSQVHGFAAVIANQAGTDLKLPLIASPGAPAALTQHREDRPARSPRRRPSREITTRAHSRISQQLRAVFSRK